MAIVHQSSTTNSGTSTTATFNKPTGTVAGDVLVAFFGGSPSSAPTGWVLFASETTLGLWGYYKVAGGSEPASYSWPQSFNATFDGGISRYSGVDNGTPMDVAASTAVVFGTTTAVAPSITTVTANAMLIGGVLVGVATITPPSGFTERWERAVGTTFDVEHASGIQAAAGASGAKTWTLSANDSSSVILGALRDASVSAQTITATGIASAEAFGSDSAQFAPIQTTGIPSGETFGAAALAPGVATISPTGVPSSETFGIAALVTTGQIAGAGIPSGEAFGSASIHGAAVTITVPSIGSAEAFGVPSLANDEFDGDLILTWVVDKRANRVRFVFESTESMSSLRIRELEVWARSTGRQ